MRLLLYISLLGLTVPITSEANNHANFPFSSASSSASENDEIIAHHRKGNSSSPISSLAHIGSGYGLWNESIALSTESEHKPIKSKREAGQTYSSRLKIKWEKKETDVAFWERRIEWYLEDLRTHEQEIIDSSRDVEEKNKKWEEMNAVAVEKEGEWGKRMQELELAEDEYYTAREHLDTVAATFAKNEEYIESYRDTIKTLLKQRDEFERSSAQLKDVNRRWDWKIKKEPILAPLLPLLEKMWEHSYYLEPTKDKYNINKCELNLQCDPECQSDKSTIEIFEREYLQAKSNFEQEIPKFEGARHASIEFGAYMRKMFFERRELESTLKYQDISDIYKWIRDLEYRKTELLKLFEDEKKQKMEVVEDLERKKILMEEAERRIVPGPPPPESLVARKEADKAYSEKRSAEYRKNGFDADKENVESVKRVYEAERADAASLKAQYEEAVKKEGAQSG